MLYLDKIIKDGVELNNVFVNVISKVVCFYEVGNYDTLDLHTCKYRLYSDKDNKYFQVNGDKLLYLYEKYFFRGNCYSDELYPMDSAFRSLMRCLVAPNENELYISLIESDGYTWTFYEGKLNIEGKTFDDYNTYILKVSKSDFFRAILKYEMIHGIISREFKLTD